MKKVFFILAMQLEGSEFLDEGLNQITAVKAQNPNH